MTAYTGHDLIALGATPGPEFADMLREVNARPHTRADVEALVRRNAPPQVLPMNAEPAPCRWNITARSEAEEANVAAVRATMDIVLRTPCVIEGVVMPDACPAGPPGTIPVGGVVATRDAICPGMHSADICCSLMATEFADSSPAEVMAAAHAATHFGPGGRPAERAVALPDALREDIASLPYAGLADIAASHLGTQGDGNHFLYVGTLESSGRTVMVTHHGSRGFGARLYKAGMKRALEWREKLSPATPKANAWIPYDSDDGRAYWRALQVVRAWTKANHEALHALTLEAVGGDVAERHWNEHNFVFREEDAHGVGTIWHAKGATPIHAPFLPDTTGVQIVPLNMAEPVLFVRGERNASNRGFAPHGAGRNASRTAHKRSLAGRADAEVFAEETAGLDVRFWCGRTDVSELPSAYKDAASVTEDMRAFDLAEVVDRVLPYGSIMAGDVAHDAPWKRRREARRAARSGA